MKYAQLQCAVSVRCIHGGLTALVSSSRLFSFVIVNCSVIRRSSNSRTLRGKSQVSRFSVRRLCLVANVSTSLLYVILCDAITFNSAAVFVRRQGNVRIVWRKIFTLHQSFVGLHRISHPHQTSSTASTLITDRHDLMSVTDSNIMDKNI